MEELGGARVHAEITGNAHFFAKSELECFDSLKSYLIYSMEQQPKAKVFPPKEPKFKGKMRILFLLILSNPTMSGILSELLSMTLISLNPGTVAPNIVIGFGRMNGQTVGFVANQPLVLAGVLVATAQIRQPVSFVSVTPSTFLLLLLRTCLVICLVWIRNTQV